MTPKRRLTATNYVAHSFAKAMVKQVGANSSRVRSTPHSILKSVECGVA